MSRKKKSDAITANETPFFARYLEGQDSGTSSSARVRGHKSLEYKTAKASPSKQTLKYPSDRDEWELYPYYISAADIPKKYAGGKVQTLKYPSDSDEERYDVNYLDLSEIPRTAAKPKSSARVALKKKK